MSVDVAIRNMGTSDLPAVHRLLKQLGYEVELDEVEQRFGQVEAAASHAAFVASVEIEIVGFMHIFARPALEKPFEVIVQSLVVDEGRRQDGIGRSLMDHAERWSLDKGCKSVALNSNTDRDDAHAFYQSLGYEAIAESTLFRKQIA